MIKDIHTLRRKEESEKERIQERNINLLLCFLFIAVIILAPLADTFLKI
jgi:hypothetical protein